MGENGDEGVGKTFEGDRDQIANVLLRKTPNQWSGDLRRACVNEAIAELNETKKPEGLPEVRGSYASIEGGYYVVLDSDLNIFEEGIGGLIDYIADVSNPIKLVPKLVRLLFKFRRIGVDISNDHAFVLESMRGSKDANVSWSISDLWTRCALKFPSGLTDRRLEELLSELAQMETRSKEKCPLVIQDGERWRLAAGV